MLALMFEGAITMEKDVRTYNVDAPAATTDALAALLKVQPQTAKPALPPSDAAQAPEAKTAAAPADTAKPALKSTSKKAKAKADPAPALPANEPAAPVKTHDLEMRQAWPFPLKDRA